MTCSASNYAFNSIRFSHAVNYSQEDSKIPKAN